MPSTVWFAPAKLEDEESLTGGLRRICQALSLPNLIGTGDLIGIKVHVGEGSLRDFGGPRAGSVLVEEIKALGGKPFFTDTCVLYRSARSDAVDHTRLAHERGYCIQSAGAPFLVADGLTGTYEETVNVPVGEGIRVTVAGMARRAQAFITLAHPTGHLAMGYGGVVKSLGMGLASRKGKLAMHSVSKPFISSETCIGCGECLPWCPEDALEMVGGKARIQDDICIGCGECLTVCRIGAVGFDWKASSESLQRRTAEHALAVVHGRTRRFIHLSLLLGVTKDCDCLRDPGPPLFPDIGILGSKDPVAIDQATLDLIEDRTGRSLASWSYPRIDPSAQLVHGETIGLGSRSYVLEAI